MSVPPISGQLAPMRMHINLPLQHCLIVKRFVPVPTVRTNVAKLCSTLKLLAVANSGEIARTSGSCHGDLTHGRSALALAYAKMMQTAITLLIAG